MKAWKIVLASDHAGFNLKTHLADFLKGLGCEVTDAGTHSPAPCDYPDFAAQAGRRLADGEFERGVFVCGTGGGIAMAANKIPGVRAAACHLEYAAQMARAHNDANVLCLGGRVAAPELAEAIVLRFLQTEYEGGRHDARLRKLARLDGSLPHSRKK